MKGFPNNEKLNTKMLNDVIRLSRNILKMLFIFLGIIGLYAITLIFKEWKILAFIWTLLKILAPFFIGLVIAWLLEPAVSFLYRRGINRVLSSVLVYTVVIAILYLIITTIFPLLIEEVNDFIKIMPSIVDAFTNWSSDFLSKFKDINIIDIDVIKNNVMHAAQDFVSSFTIETPAMIGSLVTSLISAIGVFALGLMVGFYLSFDFDNIGKALLSFLPRRWRDDAKALYLEANSFLFGYVKGTIIVCVLIFIVCSAAFAIIGLKAPLLFGFICAMTNIIPYLGPYLGLIPAAIVGFSQSIPLGIITIVTTGIIHTIEGNFIHPLVIGKTMNLHPVTILLSLLVFGYFFGIIGMIVAVPLIATFKSIAGFVEKKYNVFKFKEEVSKN
jgi:predicted PurR-regulated permease PerM